MSLVTKTLHRQNWDTISASNPRNAQTGRTVLIVGGTGVIGKQAARAFVVAGAARVIITSRDTQRAKTTAAEIQGDGEANKNGAKVSGLRLDVGDAAEVQGLWDHLEKEGLVIDVLVLNATKMNPPAPTDRKMSFAEMYSSFDHQIRPQLIAVDCFEKQGKPGKNLIYVSTNAIHFHNMERWYAQTSAARGALTRLLQDAAADTPAEAMQIICLHPGFVLTDTNAPAFPEPARSRIPFDDASLPANFYVWAATRNAAFLHGRFAWANWDVDELREACGDKLQSDPGFLKVGVQGIASQDFGMLMQGMARSV